MSFFNSASPIYFWGLLTLAVPFLLLLTRAKAYHTTSFSSLEFLRTMTRKASNFIEWKKWLLLLTRLLFLALLTWAFALPFFNRDQLSSFGNVNEHWVFVLDDSYSMDYQESDQPTLFVRAQDEIASLIESEDPRGAVFSLYTFNDSLRLIAKKMKDADLFLEEVMQLDISDRASDFPNALSTLKSLLAKSSIKKQKVFLFSDFAIQDPSLKEWIEQYQKDNTKLFELILVPIQANSYQNFSIESIEMPPYPFLPEHQELIRVFYRSEGFSSGTEIELKLLFEQTVLRSQTIKIEKEGRDSFVFRHAFPVAKKYPIQVVSQPDGLLKDNSRYAIAHVHPAARVLFVEGSTYEFPFERPSFYLSQALQSFSSDKNRPQWIDLETIYKEDLGQIKFEDYDLVVVADVSEIETRYLSQLRYYLKDGGTVFFALGKNFQSELFTEKGYFSKFLGGYFSEPETLAKEQTSFRFEGIDYNYPAFRVFDFGKQGNLERISISKFFEFRPTGNLESQTLLWVNRQWPLLTKIQSGQGRLFVWGTSLNDDWTSFPKDPLYVPFMVELVKSVVLKGWQSYEEDAFVGKPLNLLVDSKQKEFQVVVKDPFGHQMTFFHRPGDVLQPYQTNVAGFYEWVLRSEELYEKNLVVRNRQAQEAQIIYAEIDRSEIVSSEAEGDLQTVIEESRYREFYYLPFFYALFGLLLIEAWLANRFYKPSWAG